MEQKRQYEAPVVEIIAFEVEDVLTTSGVGNTTEKYSIELPDHDFG